MSAQTVLLVAAGLVYFIAMQFLPRRVSRMTLIGVPAVLGYLAWRQLPTGPIGGGQAAELVSELVLAAAAGVWQAHVTRVFARDGQWYMQGGPVYLGVWVLFVAARVVLHLVFTGGIGFTTGSAGDLWIVYVALAAAWAVRSFAIYTGHPEIWPALERARRAR